MCSPVFKSYRTPTVRNGCVKFFRGRKMTYHDKVQIQKMRFAGSILRSLLPCVVFFIGLTAIQSNAKTPLGSISSIVGGALVKHEGDTSWVKAGMRMRIFENDAVAVKEESRCEITMAGDKIVRCGEKTTVMISGNNESQMKIKTVAGAVWINIKHLVKDRSFDVSTPTAVAAIRGTVFEVQCNANASNYLVFKGIVAVSSIAGRGKTKKDSTFLIKSGEQFTLVKDMELYMKDQEKTIREYLKQSDEELENFNKEEQDQFDKYQKDMQEQVEKMMTEERSAFKTLDNMSYAIRPIDANKLLKNEWIKWNQGRDKDLGW